MKTDTEVMIQLITEAEVLKDSKIKIATFKDSRSGTLYYVLTKQQLNLLGVKVE